MEGQDNRCWNCVYFRQFYTCGFELFTQSNVGLCNIKNNMVSKNDSCQKWKYALSSGEFRAQKALQCIPTMRDKLDAIEYTLQRYLDLKDVNNDNK